MDLEYTLYSLLVVTRVDNMGIQDKIYYDMLKSYSTEYLYYDNNNHIRKILRGEKFEITLIDNKCTQVRAINIETNNGYYFEYSYRLLSVHKLVDKKFELVWENE